MSKVPARWETVSRAVEIRNKLAPNVLIIGNGDAKSIVHAHQLVRETGCDGVMLGRAIFGNPFLFTNKNISNESEILYTPNLEEKLRVLIEHTKLFDEILGDVKNFALMKKHFKAYVSGFDGAGDLREELMKTNNAIEVENVINNFLS